MQPGDISPAANPHLGYVLAMNAIHVIRSIRHSRIPHEDVNLGRRRTDPARSRIDEQDKLLSAGGLLIGVVAGGGIWALLLAVGWLILH